MPPEEHDPIDRIQRDIERLFHNLVYHRPVTHFGEPTWAPAADLVVSESTARVILELAGVPRESVRVRLRGSVLEVSGVRETPHEVRGAHYHRAEIYFGPFRRAIELPWAAEEQNVEAKYRDGMLEIRVVAAKPETHHVEIERSEDQ